MTTPLFHDLRVRRIEPDTAEATIVTFEVPTGTRVDGLIWAPDRDVAYSLGI